jgi:hypothetical protein
MRVDAAIPAVSCCQGYPGQARSQGIALPDLPRYSVKW